MKIINSESQNNKAMLRDKFSTKEELQDFYKKNNNDVQNLKLNKEDYQHMYASAQKTSDILGQCTLSLIPPEQREAYTVLINLIKVIAIEPFKKNYENTVKEIMEKTQLGIDCRDMIENFTIKFVNNIENDIKPEFKSLIPTIKEISFIKNLIEQKESDITLER